MLGAAQLATSQEEVISTELVTRLLVYSSIANFVSYLHGCVAVYTVTLY